MKTKTKFIASIVTIVVLALVLTGGIAWIKAQWFDPGNYLTTKSFDPDNVWRLEAAGKDLRVYEFTPRTAPYMKCLFVAGTNKGANPCFLRKEALEEMLTNAITKALLRAQEESKQKPELESKDISNQEEEESAIPPSLDYNDALPN